MEDKCRVCDLDNYNNESLEPPSEMYCRSELVAAEAEAEVR